MAENKLKIQHLRSKELVDGKPKLPTELDEGEIAINFATGHETIAIKNDSNQIVKFDNKVDENYEPTQYNGKFESLVTETNHVKAGDTNSKAFKSVENTMSTLVDEVYKNEKAVVTTFGTVGSATGIVDADGNISYQTKADAHYIASATSVHDATVKLDNSLNGVETTVNGHQNQITAVKATADQNKTDIGGLASSIGIEKETEGTYSYPDNIGSNYFEGATSVIQAMTDLDNEIYNVNGKVRKIATAAGVINDQNVIGYQTETGVAYIEDAVSVHDATVRLDNKLQEIEDTSNAHTRDISDLAKVDGGAVRNGGRFVYQADNNTKYIAGAHSVHEATVLLDTALKQLCPINLDYVEIEGVKWLKYNFKSNSNDNLGEQYYWGSLGDQKTIFNDPNKWNNLIDVMAPYFGTGNPEDDSNNRILSPAFDIIYQMTNGRARIAKYSEFNALSQLKDTKGHYDNIMKAWVFEGTNGLLYFRDGTYKDSSPVNGWVFKGPESSFGSTTPASINVIGIVGPTLLRGVLID